MMQVHGPVPAGSAVSTQRVQCAGGEADLASCNIVFEAGGKPCSLDQDIVSVSCRSPNNKFTRL